MNTIPKKGMTFDHEKYDWNELSNVIFNDEFHFKNMMKDCKKKLTSKNVIFVTSPKASNGWKD